MLWMFRPKERLLLELSTLTGIRIDQFPGLAGKVADGREGHEADRDSIDNVTWLPSGKRIAFCYHKQLYTVPAE